MMKTPVKAIKKVADKQKASASENKKKSLIEVGVKIDDQFRGQFKSLVDFYEKEYGVSRSVAIKEVMSALKGATLMKRDL
jgi:hypothetical protein